MSKEGIHMDVEKLRVIEEWPPLENLHEVKSFIGMCSYYRRFIEKFSIIVGPLHDLTKKKLKCKWIAKENATFNQFKERLMTQPILEVLDFTNPFDVHCDACGDSIWAILSQEGHSIAYESHRLQP